MLISTVCPRCQTTYQVQEELRGKAMRCAVKTCEKIFLITEAPPDPVPATPTRIDPSRQQTGSVGELVPLLPVESDPQPDRGFDLVPILPSEPAAPDWRSAPPPRRTDSKPPASPAPTPEPAPKKSTAVPKRSPSDPDPVVKPAGEWVAPPPVRRQADDEAPAAEGAADGFDALLHAPPGDVHYPPEHHEPTAAPRTRMAKWIVIPFLILTVGGLAAGVVFVIYFINTRQDRLAQMADEAYENKTFRVAAERYQQLAKDYPDSDRIARYQFRADLAQLRLDAKELPDNAGDQPKRTEAVSSLIDDFGTFITKRDKDPLMPEHADDVGASLQQMLQDFAEKAAENPQDDSALEVVTKARPVIDKAKALKRPKGSDSKPPAWDKVDEAFAKLDAAIERMRKEKAILAALQKLVGEGSYRALVAAEELLESNESDFPGLSKRAEVEGLITELYQNHLKRIKYSPDTGGKKAATDDEEDEPAVIIDPLLGGSPGTSRRGTPVVLALARGVLYGLDRDSGRVRWATRVGIDTTILPVRVPARAGSRERILAVSSDTKLLTALDNDGNTLWRYRLKAACLGRPVVVENRAYLATLDGVVHEIELIRGKRLGTYDLGQRLTLGGTHEPKTDLVYFPADDGCVYVLDVKDKKRPCKAILYSRHPTGSLRGEAILVGPEGPDAPGYLILAQTAGLDAVELRVFDLPIANQFEDRTRQLASARALTPQARLDGWTWFRPYHDPEKLVMLSDAGVLGLFGIRQARNRDQALFPVLPGGGLNLAPMLSGKVGVAREQDLRRGRAEVVQLQGDDLWVLAANQLQRLKLAWDQDAGPRVIPAWTDGGGGSREVGAPLHAAQAFEDHVGRTGLVLVTQPPRRPACWASCFDDESGKLRWRRQLGLVCEGEPVALAAPHDEPVQLLLDQSGALFAVEPRRYKVDEDSQWLSDGKLTRLAKSLDENPEQPPVVVRVDGQSVYVIASPGDGKTLVIRHVSVEPKEWRVNAQVVGSFPFRLAHAIIEEDRPITVRESTVTMPSPLWGTPALVGSHLVLPMANEKIARLPLPLAAVVNDVETGFDWKAVRATPEERGHVLALGGDRFLTTDGLRQLRSWEWPAKGTFKPLPAARGDGPTLELADRLVAAPVLVPGRQGGAAHVAVADSGGMLRLLEVQPDGGLEEKRAWPLDGAVTAGPWVEAVNGTARIGCVVDRTKLVWINPASKDVLWTHKADAAIVGRPRLALGKVVVADESGRYVSIDPARGTPGKGYRLRGSLAASAAPVAFHSDRLLAPLSDGTLLLLSRTKIEGK